MLFSATRAKRFWNSNENLSAVSSKLHFTCLDEQFERKVFQKGFQNKPIKSFWTMSEKYFGGVVKTAFYVSRGTFWWLFSKNSLFCLFLDFEDFFRILIFYFLSGFSLFLSSFWTSSRLASSAQVVLLVIMVFFVVIKNVKFDSNHDNLNPVFVLP